MDYLFSVLRKLLLVWYHLRFEALLLQLSILTFHLLNSKILKIPGVNLAMDHWQWCPSHSNKGTSNRKWQVMNISTCITEQPFRSKWDYIYRNSQLNIELLRKRRVFYWLENMERTTQRWIRKLHVQKLSNNKPNSFQSIIVRSDPELQNCNIERSDPAEFSRTCSIFQLNQL